MVRGKATKPDRRELPGKASIKKATAKPKGIKPEHKEPKRKDTHAILGQSGGKHKHA